MATVLIFIVFFIRASAQGGLGPDPEPMVMLQRNAYVPIHGNKGNPKVCHGVDCEFGEHDASARTSTSLAEWTDSMWKEVAKQAHESDHGHSAAGNKGVPILYSPSEPAATNLNRGIVIMERRLVGCYPRVDDDEDSSSESSYMDRACVDTTRRHATSPCRSGLPFFNVKLGEDETFLDCFAFCISKGLDLFGVIRQDDGVEQCRCGASVANFEAWNFGEPRPEALLPKMGVSLNSSDCALMVWQYTGGFEADGIPGHLVRLTASESAYVDSIATGQEVRKPEDAEVASEDRRPRSGERGEGRSLANARHTLHKAGAKGEFGHKGLCLDSKSTGHRVNGTEVLCSDAKQKGWCQYASIQVSCPVACNICSNIGGWMPCYPGTCAGWPLWPTKQPDGKVLINYFFDEEALSNVSNPEDTKAAFRAAASEFQMHTCILFVEGTRSSAPIPRIMVGHYDDVSCWSSMGFSNGSEYAAKINLGSCRSIHHKGVMMREISRALGVSRGEKRTDAQAEVARTNPSSKIGPDLEVQWNNITESGEIVLSNRSSVYPISGHASHEKDVLVIRPPVNHIDAAGSLEDYLIGQRADFSAGDIRQLNDMYQCATPAELLTHSSAVSSSESSHTFAPSIPSTSFTRSAFVLGEPGVDGCPDGYVPVKAPQACELAVAALNLTFDSANRNVENTRSLCYLCGGCQPPTARFNERHGGRGQWVCQAHPTPPPPPAPIPDPAAEYVLGQKGKDECPEGFEPITSLSMCEAASVSLNFTFDALKINVSAARSVCYWCGGCRPQATRFNELHYGRAQWVCKAQATPQPTPALTPAPAPAQFGLGAKGVDECPDGFESIRSLSVCEAASAALNFTFDSSKLNVHDAKSVCYWCGGCKSPATRFNELHYGRATWVCQAKSTPQPTTAPTPSPPEPPAQLQYVLGEFGVDTCPDGYQQIADPLVCETASAALGFRYDSSLNDHVGGESSICYWCGGCKPRTTRVNDRHYERAKWVCQAKPLLSAVVYPLAPIWRAASWSSCSPREDKLPLFTGDCFVGCTRTRTVECVDPATAVVLPASSCEVTMKLAATELCECLSKSPCMDHCNPGFTAMDGFALDCASPEVTYWCTQDSSDSEMVSAIRSRCPASCGLCAALK